MLTIMEALSTFFDSLDYPAQRDIAPDVVDNAQYIVWAVMTSIPDEAQANYADDTQGTRVDLQVRCWAETGLGAMQVYDHVEEEIRDNPLEPSGWHQIRKAQRTLFRPVRDQDGRHHQVVSEWYITLTRAD